MTPYWSSLIGGMLLGVSAVLLMLLNGRVAGISGIVGRLVQGQNLAANAAFVLGLVSGPMLYWAWFGQPPVVTISASWPVILISGFLVGFGTRMGSGCTSGHGIIGLARFSKRSLAATLTFLTFGIAAATIWGAVS